MCFHERNILKQLLDRTAFWSWLFLKQSFIRFLSTFVSFKLSSYCITLRIESFCGFPVSRNIASCKISLKIYDELISGKCFLLFCCIFLFLFKNNFGISLKEASYFRVWIFRKLFNHCFWILGKR